MNVDDLLESENESTQHDQSSGESSSDSDVSDITPSSLRSRRRIVSSSEAIDHENTEDVENSENDDWEEVFEDRDSLPEFMEYQELCGPKRAPPPTASPIAYFYLFFNDALLNDFVKETNDYASNHFSQPSTSSTSYTSGWTNISMAELKGFLACIINMGITKRPTIESYWFTKKSQYLPWFHEMFSRNRFQLILKFFHIANTKNHPRPGTPGYDPCANIQPLIDNTNNLFRHHYTPREQLSIDESLVGTKNQTQLMQYLPNKRHHRWGIKFWMLCDSITNYCLAFYIYRGAKSPVDKTEIVQKGLGHTVVTKLLAMGNYLSKGYHIFIDNFFTSVPLAKYLYSVGTYITGTIRRNRKFIPKQFSKKFDVGEKRYFRQGPMLAAAFREKRSQRFPVLLLSTKCKAESTIRTITRRSRTREVVKPSIIQSYNDYMGGIDTSDMMLYTYLDERRTVKYWKKICFNIFSRMILNSYIIYKDNLPETTKPLTRLKFIISIIGDLSEEWLQVKNGLPAVERSNSVRKLETLPNRKEKDCCVCSNREKNRGVGKRRRSRTICTKCQKGIHGLCFTNHKC
jgi:hypothetical protein